MEAISQNTYTEYVSVGKNGRKILYVRLQKALYVCLHSALLFYRKLNSELEDSGLLLNPYAACVANKWVNGSQITVTWHFDDLKISHKDAGELNNMITHLESIYSLMTVKRGKKHTYLGMDMGFNERGTVKVSMKGYIDESVDEFPEDVTTPVVSLEADHMFKINTSGKRLSEERAILFHRIVTKLLFVSKRARIDI